MLGWHACGIVIIPGETVTVVGVQTENGLESAKLYRFLSLDHRPVPIVGLVDGDGEVEARHGGALCGCLPRDGGPAALAALLPDLFAVDPEQGEPALEGDGEATVFGDAEPTYHAEGLSSARPGPHGTAEGGAGAFRP